MREALCDNSKLENEERTLEKQDGVIEEFDNALWGSLLDYITVYSKDDIRFTFKDGTEMRA